MRLKNYNDKITIAVAIRLFRMEEAVITDCVRNGLLAMDDDGLVSGEQLYEIIKSKRAPCPQREVSLPLTPPRVELDEIGAASQAVRKREELKAQLRIVHGGKAVSA
jgi:hypothetical protein